MKKSVLLSLSGGADSATLLGLLKSQGYEITAASFNYGSKHNKYENLAARSVADFYNVKLIEMDMTPVFQHFKSDLLLSGNAIPEGDYDAPSMAATVVPSRNMIFISFLTGLAESLDISHIAIGAHAGDHHIYPDCRPVFMEAMQKAINCATEDKVRLLAPLLYSNKAAIIKLGLRLKVPYALTRTCYKDQLFSCGVCGSCNERLEAFKLNGKMDPIQYEAEKEE